MIFFGKNLRYLREKNELTQEDMMPLLGIRNTTWSNYENGVSEPDIKLLVGISKYFGVTLDELIAVDLAAQQGNTTGPRRHRLYTTNDAAVSVEEPQTGLTYIVKELKKLRKEVDAIKHKPKNGA